MKTAKYEWLGDRGEMLGHVVFESGSRGQIVELDEKAADDAIAEGFTLRKITKEEVKKNGNL